MVLVIGMFSFVFVVIVVGDVLLMSKVFDKGVDLFDNCVIYWQIDKVDVIWQFDGCNWQCQVVMDSVGDGLGNLVECSVGVSYEKVCELGVYVYVKVVELVLGKVLLLQDFFSILVKDGEGCLDNFNWYCDVQIEQWMWQVKISVFGVNDWGVYEMQIVSFECVNELNCEVV